MSNANDNCDPPWHPEPRRWGRADALALLAWTAAIVLFFWDAATLRRALFYFDITEINYPYRDFLASELRAGRFSRWFPGLYCGMPLYSESQAGYLHPFKYLLYPWMPTWKAFNLDTIGSVWLSGAAGYGWLRRHVGAAGALTGAAIVALSGYTWAHLVHTSMINALVSVPLAFWALECAWDGGRSRGVALGGLALACQVFAGHLQDTILTGTALGAYGFARALHERAWPSRAFVLGTTAGVVALAIAVSAVQWVPSKELIDRTPRSEGLAWDELTYGSWHPELLPTLVVREAYGTRARDTDWMDGFYPYHEMNGYVGLIALALAIIGTASRRDRWVSAWMVVGGVGVLLMLGRYTFLFDHMHKIPIIGRGRIPVRYHLWVVLAVAVLASVGVDRLSRLGRVRLRPAAIGIALLLLACVPILIHVYAPVWTDPHRWTSRDHIDRYRWLGDELIEAGLRAAVLVALAWLASGLALRARNPRRRAALAASLPVLVILDLLGSHRLDVPTVSPSYWTDPPASARWLKSRPGLRRVFGKGAFHSGEPGYASMPGRVDFLAARDTLAWSLPPVWGIDSAIGETPIVSRRRILFTQAAGLQRFEIEGDSHLLFGLGGRSIWGDPIRIGTASIYTNPRALPRVRLLGRPIYADDLAAAVAALERASPDDRRDRIVVEDPDRPLAEGAPVSGSARIVTERPERVEVATDSPGPSYLFLADTFDPGWSAMLDGRPVPIRPAHVAFRAVFVPAGRHTVVFDYRPAGFMLGLLVTIGGLAVSIALIAGPRRWIVLEPTHGPSGWPRSWPTWTLAAALLIVAVSAVGYKRGEGIRPHPRWNEGFHRFTWGAGIEAIRPARAPLKP